MQLEAVRERVAEAARRAGRDPAGIGIVAVTKGHPIGTVREAAAGGLLDIGENRVQEALQKQDAWPDAPVRWHLIGHLQRNKAKHAVGRFALIHSVDSARLAEELERVASAKGVVQDVLVQVNVAGEVQKDGVSLQDAPALVEGVAGLPHLRLTGLMTMAPLTDDERLVRSTFRGLARLRDDLGTRVPGLGTLSMGMSSDFAIAIEEGATMLRLGTVLFGERQP